MKKIVVGGMMIVFFSLLSPQAWAQVDPKTLNIPGACGTLYGKCCEYKEIRIVKPDVAVDIGVRILLNKVYSVIESIIKPVLNPFNDIAKSIVQPCAQGTPSTPGNTNDPSCQCIPPQQDPLKALREMCDRNPRERTVCLACVEGNPPGIWSSVGCVKADFRSFIQDTVLRLGVSFAGIAALLCIIYASILMQTSRGNPESIKKAQELLTSCIMGLLLIIFSVFILRLIGITILRIPGLN